MKRVLLPLAEGFEDLEAVTTVDILRRGGIEVVTAGLRPGPVRGARGTQVLPDSELGQASIDDFDMIALPGGQPGVANLRADARVIRLVKEMAAAEKPVAAICAAPMVLADAGILEGRRATAYPGSLEALDVKGLAFENSVLVTDGNIITSRGPGTAVDFGLALVEHLEGKAKRDEVEKALVR